MVSHPGQLYCGWMMPTDSMVFVFSRPLDATFHTWSDTYSAVSGSTLTFSTTTFANDTVTLKPGAAGWTQSAIETGTPTVQPVSLTVKDTSGTTFSPAFSPVIVNPASQPFVYLSGSGSDSNSGVAPNAPKQTLDAARVITAGAHPMILAAPTTTSAGVVEGYYTGFPTGATLQLDTASTTGISLCGGFNSTFTARNPVANLTTLVDLRLSGGASFPTSPPIAAITAGATGANFSVVEGFNILSAGHDLNPGVATASTINASAGVLITAGTPTIRNNTIQLAGAANSVGIFVSGASTAPSLVGNTIEAFNLPALTYSLSGSNSFGIYVKDAAPTVSGTTTLNSIPLAAGSYTYGIYVNNSTVTTDLTISESTLAGGVATSSYGMYVNQITSAHNVNIDRNVSISGGGGTGSSTGIWIAATTGTAHITDNALIDGGDGGYSSGSSQAVYISTGVTGAVIGGVNAGNTINGGGHDGGGGSAFYSYGIDDLGTNTVVSFNTINGGTGKNTTDGIFVTGTGGSYRNSTISGGGHTGAASIGITLQPGGAISGVKIFDNVISGCADYGAGASNICNGVTIENAFPSGTQIGNNTIYGGDATGTGGQSVAINDSGSNATIIGNNLLFAGSVPLGSSYCVTVSNAATLNLFVNNNLFSCGTGLFTDNGTPHTLSSGDTFSLAGATTWLGATSGATGSTSYPGTTSLSPGFVTLGADPGKVDVQGAVDWHLTASSPGMIRAGAFIGGADNDRDNNARTADPTVVVAAGLGWSIGAYRSPNAP